MMHGHPWELLFHRQIYLDVVVFPLEAASQLEDSNSQFALEVAYIEDYVQNQDPHQHSEEADLEVDPMIDEGACAPFEDLTFASAKQIIDIRIPPDWTSPKIINVDLLGRAAYMHFK